MNIYIVVVLMMLVTNYHAFGQIPPQSSNSRKCENKYNIVCETDVCPEECPLLNVGSNTVSKADFLAKIVDIDWLVLYIVETGEAIGRSGNRVHGKWTLPAANPSGNVTTRETAFQRGPGNDCMIRIDELNITETDDCGVSLLGEREDGRLTTESFFSQDLEKYCWVYRCSDVNDTAPFKCDIGRYYLQIPESRTVIPPQTDITEIELNLTGVPWGEIWADFQKAANKGIYFASTSVPRYVWLGKECLVS